LPQQFNDAIYSTIDKVRDWGHQLVKTARQKIENVRHTIISTIQSVPSSMQNIGRQMMDGLINGINSMTGAVMNAAQSIAQSAVNSIQSALRINSPSRVFEEIGRYTGEGFIAGIKSMDDAITKTVNDTFDSLSSLSSDTFERDLNLIARAAPAAAYKQHSQNNRPIEINIENTWYVNDEVDIDLINRKQAQRVRDALRSAGFSEVY